MNRKARIRKRDGRWQVDLPGYGFTATTQVRCTDWQGAVAVVGYYSRIGKGEHSGPVAGNFVDLDRSPQMLYRQWFIG